MKCIVDILAIGLYLINRPRGWKILERLFFFEKIRSRKRI